MRLVMKFGGTSVGSSEGIKRVSELVKRYSDEELVVVISAMRGTTDRLIELSELMRDGKREKSEKDLKELEETHLSALGMVKRGRDEVRRMMESLFEELRMSLTGVYLLRELTPRSRDLILSFGERLSATLVYGSLKSLGLKVKMLTGRDAGIVTDSNFGEARPLIEATYHQVRRRLMPLLERGVIPVVTGFIATDQDGVTTTLGRGGSDYTATLLGAALDVDEVWLWSDVDGLMTADPRMVKGAKALEFVSYEEAIEMAAFRVKGMHPRALEPVMSKGIPVRIRNTFNSDCDGTLIEKRKGDTVKAVAMVKGAGLVTVSGAGMIGMPGVAARIFGALASRGVNVRMISQSVSESNISVIVSMRDLYKAVDALELELLGGPFVKHVEAEEGLCVVAVIGSGMKEKTGIAARVFGAVSKRGINVRMIAQGSSENNISFVVKEEDGEEAVRALHKEFNL